VVVASRTVVRRGAVVRPGYAGGGVRWARPGRYYWPRGGAIAAGAAIGFVTAATAAAWAGAAPAPGMCWYYTDPSRTQGFWDYCQPAYNRSRSRVAQAFWRSTFRLW